MKKIIMIFAAMAAVLSSCGKNAIEPVSTNNGKDIVLNISVSNPGADTKALIKSAWAENDQIKIWFDANTSDTPDLVVKYDGSSKWTQDGTANNVPASGNGYVKAVYNNSVIVASKDNYTFENNTLTFNIANWVFLTEVQVVVKGLTSASAGSYTLACDKFTPLASTGDGYTVGSDAITASAGTKGDVITGISNTEGVAFVFATADYSSTAAAFKFTLTDNTSSSAVTKEYTATTDKISGTTGSMTAIKALTIASSKFAVPANPLYVEITAKFDGDSNPARTLKWYRNNLAITNFGKKFWKGNASGAVKVPGTDEDVVVGDYFQWAAYAGYCGEASAADKGLLIYNSFTNTKCVGVTGTEDGFAFKSADSSNKYQFKTSNTTGYIGISPYYSSGYQKYTDTGHSILYRETSYTGHNDDVANIILGDNWRMPTSAEFLGLKNATYWAWDNADCGCYVFSPDATHTAGTSVNSIPSELNKIDALLFFPAAGFANGTSLGNVGYGGHCWSSSLFNDTVNAYCLRCGSGYVVPQTNDSRYFGYSVRPVSD